MNPFVYAGLPCRVVFGVGSLMQLPSEVERLGAGRVLILSTPEKSLNLQRVTEILGDRVAGVYDKAVMHVPLAIAEEARHLAQELGADCCVTVGAGPRGTCRCSSSRAQRPRASRCRQRFQQRAA